MKLDFFRRLFQRSPAPASIRGFTLLELLVAIIIGSIITTLLTQLLVELLQVERRETLVDNTQRDMRRALEFMASDVREAVYVYSSPGTSSAIASIAGALPSSTNLQNNVVLAFWRLDPIEDLTINCAAQPTPARRQECDVLRVRQASYALVVYQIIPHDGNANWPGRARIVRFHFPKYSNPNTLTQNVGFVDPIDRSRSDLTFANWRASAVPTVRGTVLVDFVDTPTNTVAGTPTGCPTGTFRSPSNATVSTSFFACIRDPEGNPITTNLNQDVEIFLRGNFEPVAGVGVRALSQGSALPTLRTGVLVRGVLDKRGGSGGGVSDP